MDKINIKLASVIEAAQEIRNCNEMMYQCLQECKNQMDQLSNVWISESSETVRNRFAQFSKQFEIQRQIIDSYAQFLDHTANTYDSIEMAINSNASSFE